MDYRTYAGHEFFYPLCGLFSPRKVKKDHTINVKYHMIADRGSPLRLCLILSEHLTNHYVGPLVRGAAHAAAALGYALIVYTPLDIDLSRSFGVVTFGFRSTMRTSSSGTR